MKQPFEYCALRYLLLWEKSEKALHTSMSVQPTLDTLRKSMHHFRVSRTFKGINSDATAERVLKALQETSSGFTSDPAATVERLTARFCVDFEQSNLSAASKLLWLVRRKPFLIYDARAVTALNRLGHKFSKRSYADYAAAWTAAYKNHRTLVRTASAQLPALQPFFSAWHTTPDSLEQLSRKPWFRERVFDIYLWELGGDA